MGNETTAQSTTSVKITDISKTAINSGWARDITLQNLVDNSADANSILKAMAAAQGVEVKLQTEVQKDSKASLDAINQNLASGNKDRTRYDREYLSSVSDLEKSLSAVTQNLKYGLSNLASSLHSASPETFLQSLGSVTGGIFGAGLLKSLTGSGVLGAFEKLGEAAVGGAVAVSVMAINMSKQFQTLSDTGNNFNGSMDKLKDASMNLGMNYDDMSQVLTKYSSLGAAMGDKQITEGTRFNKSLKDSIDYMTSYGMSANDYTDAVDSFASALNTAGDRVGKSFQDLEPVVGNYLDNLSAVSALTGQSKKQLEEQHQSLMDSERTKAEFMTLTDKQQSNLNAATANLPPALAQMMMDAMVAQIKGMPALESAATRQYMASSPEAQNAVNAGINGQSNAAQLAMTSAADYFNKNSNL
jgi:phosphotransferase system HPr-like phosphotransfer protein